MAVVVDESPVFAAYVVWHPSCAPAERLAQYLFTSLYSDPYHPGRRGLGIRVRYRTSAAAGQPPSPIPRDSTGRIAVVVLVDAHLVVEPAWCEYVAAIVDRTPADLVIPVAHRRAVAKAGGTVDYLLYPDPPLGTAELEVLRRSDPLLKPVTPLTLLPALMRRRGGS